MFWRILVNPYVLGLIGFIIGVLSSVHHETIMNQVAASALVLGNIYLAMVVATLVWHRSQLTDLLRTALDLLSTAIDQRNAAAEQAKHWDGLVDAYSNLNSIQREISESYRKCANLCVDELFKHAPVKPEGDSDEPVQRSEESRESGGEHCTNPCGCDS